MRTGEESAVFVAAGGPDEYGEVEADVALAVGGVDEGGEGELGGEEGEDDEEDEGEEGGEGEELRGLVDDLGSHDVEEARQAYVHHAHQVRLPRIQGHHLLHGHAVMVWYDTHTHNRTRGTGWRRVERAAAEPAGLDSGAQPQQRAHRPTLR